MRKIDPPITLNYQVGDYISTRMPHTGGAKVISYEFGEAADYYDRFSGYVVYEPTHGGSWVDQRIRVAFDRGYYDDTGMLWVEGFQIRFGGRVMTTVELEGKGLPLLIALDYMKQTTDLLGARIIGNDIGNEITGSAGDDILEGNRGRDTLLGKQGSDKLIGGAGLDYIRGGSGADIFVYESVTDSRPGGRHRDVIYDFGGHDRIDLHKIDADTRTAANDAFHFIGEKEFSGEGAEIRYAGNVVKADVDGDGAADLSIFLLGDPALDASDFIL